MYREKDVVVRTAFRLPKDHWKHYPATAYEIKTDGKYGWLKRVAWWTLQKLQATKQHWGREHMVTETRVQFNSQEAFDLLYEKAIVCMDTCYGRRPEKILVGAEDFADIMNNQDIMKMPAFNFSGQLAESVQTTSQDLLPGWKPEFKLYDVPVYVIPHMQGILVL